MTFEPGDEKNQPSNERKPTFVRLRTEEAAIEKQLTGTATNRIRMEKTNDVIEEGKKLIKSYDAIISV